MKRLAACSALLVSVLLANTALLPGTLAQRSAALQRASPRRLQNLRQRTSSLRERKKLARERRREPSFALEKTQPNQFFMPSIPLPSLNATSHFLLLGGKGAPIATIKVTPQDEPVHVRNIQVTFSSEVSSFLALQISDEFGFVLGNATLDLSASPTRNAYTLNLSEEKAYAVDRRETVIFAVRPIVKEEHAGGVSGEGAQITSIVPTAKGVWTNRENTVSTSGPDFQKHQTTNAILHSITRSGKERGTFTTGLQKAIGAFRFEAAFNEDGNPALASLTFSVSAPTEVALSNVSLRDPETATSHACSVSSGSITCSPVPSAVGSLRSPRTLTVTADISLSGTHPDPFLQLELNSPGRPGSPGDITWTDGDTSFIWVPFDPPVAQGTLWK